MRRGKQSNPPRVGRVCEDVAVLGEVLEFMRSIWGVSHGLQSMSKRMETEFGITGPQRLAVRILGRCPGASAGQLAQVLHLHPSTLTGVLRRLEARGIVQRSADPHDRRGVRLRLTAAGRTIDRRQPRTVEDAVSRVLGSLPRARIKTAAEVLRALDAALNNPAPGRKRPPKKND